MKDCKKYEPFYEFIEDFKVKNFKVSEILVAVTRKYNRIPPKSLWSNIICTILILDELRDHFDMPITISSGYRTKRYNAQIGGVVKSQHQAFTAIDFHVKGATSLQVKDVLLDWRNNERLFLLRSDIKRKALTVAGRKIPFGNIEIIEQNNKKYFKLKGGIGIYSSFVHLDTRGINAYWD